MGQGGRRGRGGGGGEGEREGEGEGKGEGERGEGVRGRGEGELQFNSFLPHICSQHLLRNLLTQGKWSMNTDFHGV